MSHCFHSGEDSCFTTMSTTVYAMGYDSKTALTSSDCASHCLTSSSCGAVYVTAGSSCSMLQYNTGLPSRLSAPHLAYAHLYHRSRYSTGQIEEKMFELTLHLKIPGMSGNLVHYREPKCKQFLNSVISARTDQKKLSLINVYTFWYTSIYTHKDIFPSSLIHYPPDLPSNFEWLCYFWLLNCCL